MEVFQEHKRDIIAIAILVLLLSISIGYAALSSNLTINGASQIKDAVWDIHWENVQITSGSVTAISAPTIDSNKTTVSYEVHFDTPGEFYEFTVDAKNSGTIDGMINTINSNLNGNPISTLPNYFIYTVSYDDDTVIQTKQRLNAGQKETYKVRIEYKKDIQVSDLPSTDQDLILSFTVTYVQADSTAVVRPKTIYHYTASGNPFKLNEPVPNNVNVYDTYQEAINEFGHNIFWRIQIEDNIITHVDTGFLHNGNAYYLNNYINHGDASMEVFEENRVLLYSIFGESNCPSYGPNSVGCTGNDMLVSSDGSGASIAFFNGYVCYILNNNTEYVCEYNFNYFQF